jgi:Tol biopolymer transport system component
MARTLAVTAALGLLAPAAVAAVPMPPVTAELPAPDAVATRVAFTQGTGGLVEAAYSIGSAGGVEYLASPDVEPVPGSEGDRELSTTFTVSSAATSASSWVGTTESTVGDVYVRYDQGDPIRITCDDAEVSHPVVSPDGTRVAYATRSDDETWRIEIATIGDPPCTGGIVDTVPRGPGDDVWPTWLPLGFGFSWDLAFSSTREDPLGDLYIVNTAEIDAEPIRITDDPGADVQPSATEVMWAGEAQVPVLAFGTTRYRPDGSIALIYLVGSPEMWEDSVEDPWANSELSTPQGSEPVTVATEGGFQGGAAVLTFTSAEYDPYGDVFATELSIDLFEFEDFEASVGESYPVFATPGVAESHAAWIDPPSGSPEPGEPDTILRATAGSIPDDVGDVEAANGENPRVFPGSTEQDDDGAAYSPDGAWLVFSTESINEEGQVGRRLMLAAADGTAVAPLGYAWDPGTGDGSGLPAVDVNPAWSPDGSRIAFERRYVGEGVTEQIMVAQFVTDGSVGETLPVTDPFEDGYFAEPSWAPDGHTLAATGWTEFSTAAVGGSDQQLTLIDLSDPGSPVLTPISHLGEDCEGSGCFPVPVAGRSPAWSPDGTVIALADANLPSFGTSEDAFDLRGGIGLITLNPDDRAGPVSTVTPLVGFGPDEVATPSREVLSAATDPAWSPDGSEIYLAGQPAGLANDWGIYAIAPDGTDLRTVTQESGPETEPTVQPDVDLSLTMTASPNVVPVGGASELTLTVRNEGQRPVGTYRVLVEVPAELQFGEPAPGCTLDDLILTCLPTEPLGPLGVSILTITVLGRVPGTAPDVTAVVLPGGPDRDVGNNNAATTINISGVPGTTDGEVDLAVALTLSAPTAWVGGQPVLATYTVTNTGTVPVTQATVTTGYPVAVAPSVSATSPPPADPAAAACLTGAGGCTVGPLAPGESAVLVADLLPVGPEQSGEVTAVVAVGPDAGAGVDTDPTNDAASAILTVLQPEIRLLPSVARPGDAVLAYGEDFPPGQAVMLTWSQGITANPGPYVVSAEGRLVVPLVLVTRDLLGERDVIAISPAGAFGEVRGPLLVVARSIQAPNFLFRG